MDLKRLSFLKAILFLFIISISEVFPQASGYMVKGTIDVGGGKRWDYLAVDTLHNRLFVTHATEVNVIDLAKNEVIGSIADLKGIHGVAFAYEFNKGFITNGANSTITVFDLLSLKVLDSIKIDGKKPDAIIYDGFTKRIFTFNGGSSNSTAIDAASDKIIGNVTLDGGPEFAASDNNGKIYVNLEDESAINVFDPKDLKVIAKWPIAPGEHPSGLAFDVEHKILFSGCHNEKMAVINAVTGKVITTLPIGKGIDACAFDPSDNLAFSSNGEGTITVIKENSPESFEVIDNVKTQKGARTMAIDSKTHRIYTVTMIDGKSFGVIYLDKK